MFADGGRWSGQVAAVAACVDQPAQPSGRVAEPQTEGHHVVQVAAAGGSGHTVSGRQGDVQLVEQSGEDVEAVVDVGALPSRRDGIAWFGGVEVEAEETGRSGGDADAVGMTGPGAADAPGAGGRALFPTGMAVAAERVGPVTAGGGVSRTRRPLRAWDEREDVPAAGGVAEGRFEERVHKLVPFSGWFWDRSSSDVARVALCRAACDFAWFERRRMGPARGVATVLLPWSGWEWQR